ncbi:hypothetical protein IEQ34_019597 [Dendrobium chrysotoxum]|uniref:Uncharacterized protein n=1 Tax=Dendrobium chrysotoxum TaxID=161865 RepID=A0AAV7GAE2_DENCH|nr:hypothetical protein IEQ34_019597 [Dendrobium chrysotoxum]
MAGCMSFLNEMKKKKGHCPVCRAKIDQFLRSISLLSVIDDCSRWCSFCMYLKNVTKLNRIQYEICSQWINSKVYFVSRFFFVFFFCCILFYVFFLGTV